MGNKTSSRDYDVQEVENLEHDPSLHVKKVMPYGWDGTNAVAIKTDASGQLVTEIETMSGAVSGAVSTLSTTALKVAFTGADITIPAGTKNITIQNDHASNKVYIGGSTVASDGSNAGHKLNNQADSYSFNNISSGFIVYIVASAASTTTRILYSQ